MGQGSSHWLLPFLLPSASRHQSGWGAGEQGDHADFGPELTGLIVYLTAVCRIPRRVVQELPGQVLGISLMLGSMQNSWEEASQAVTEPCTELENQLAHEPVINSDETGYRTSGDKRWLWALVTANFVFYKTALTRGAEVLVQLRYSPESFAATAVAVTRSTRRARASSAGRTSNAISWA
jgi:hypothetical protein